MDKYKVPLSIILGAAIIGFSIYFALKTQKADQVEPSVSPATSPIATTVTTEQIETSPTTSPVSSPAFTEEDAKAIKTVLADKLGNSEENLDFSVSQKTATNAKGNVREKTSEVGGGYWLAAKTDSGWKIVYDGQSTPTCSQIAHYDFPASMVPECLNSSGNVISR